MISIIVPVYKVEPYLRQCVDSILGQTYRDIDVLLIDDGSPDRCGEICDEYAEKDDRVRVFHTENRGLSATRNLGLAEAKGEYIGFVDSDDWIEPDMYEVLLRRMQETGADIGVCGVWYEYKDNTKAGTNIKDEIYTGAEAIDALIFVKLGNTVWNKLYTKKAWESVSFPEGHLSEDVPTIYKLFGSKCAVVSNSVHLYHYRQRVDSASHTRTMENLIDYWDAYHSRYKYLIKLPEVKGKSELIEKLEEQVAYASVRVWRYVYAVPKEQRDYRFLEKVSNYSRDFYPAFGHKSWSILLRVSFLCTRYVSEVLFAILYAINETIKPVAELVSC